MWDKTASVRIERVDGIVHLFNTICRGAEWCVSFESEAPVCDDLISRGWEKSGAKSWEIGITAKRMLKACSKPNCIALIAISQSAYQIQTEMINRIDIPSYIKKSILEKLTIVHPPQEIIITEAEMNRK